ncbi:tRNA A-37 threonylcarbamoyl transferase component Bud32 [Parabacteroides sp. PF5-5]|uniref:lipopolysaccharide kinase InaA family protein n=1 Tax=unclassified Parabacteroides TaxID=2649774 RepID=UPI00247714CB|nr:MULTISPECIES: lipopolysaccharide kinase InaA family protein [unclassified Parabacteroides]MDH6303388.1 tRNA A-37 threonylcarbamoyl transferase component Bud32 [Parabacteroides sp. PH5-39]MDH6314711.1 tRNA A-37 threonylcarbamoyl transferase component Bud32 [Parabacteroides sp. PF5-13]MDH6318048.1 tRNA A-37 threonylcarbamoyl transferase component Bud32 [Parabacteroides sp. PH5-13]MDH6322021.1 tRNA A-37 threonylcarbamoyl transferase component Bud32 [Parabacteroides sp. PH5-8]MDH6326144.1 tRNA 
MMKVIINPEYEHLSDFINTIPKVFNTSGEIVYEGRNILKRFEVVNVRFVVKRFKVPHLVNRIVYSSIRKSKACRSYIHAFKLQKYGINTPTPIAYIEEFKGGILSYSYYISAEIADAHEIREFYFDPVIGNRAHILDAFGTFTANMHKKNILHKDYSSGNVLYKLKDNTLEFFLVDINRMQFGRSISEEKGYENFRRLWLSDEVFTVIARSYAQAMGYDINHAVERILYYKKKFMNET